MVEIVISCATVSSFSCCCMPDSCLLCCIAAGGGDRLRVLFEALKAQEGSWWSPGAFYQIYAAGGGRDTWRLFWRAFEDVFEYVESSCEDVAVVEACKGRREQRMSDSGRASLRPTACLYLRTDCKRFAHDLNRFESCRRPFSIIEMNVSIATGITGSLARGNPSGVRSVLLGEGNTTRQELLQPIKQDDEHLCGHNRPTNTFERYHVGVGLLRNEVKVSCKQTTHT